MTSLVTGSRMRAILRSGQAPMIGHLSDYAYNNVLNGLFGSLYAGLDVVSRELTGFIPSVARDATAERAAVGQTVTYHVAPSTTTSNITPSMTVPEPTDQTIGSGTLTITKAKAANMGWIGEEQRALNQNGAGYDPVRADMFSQAIRALTNEMEADLALAAATAASRGTGTAGTLPFADGVADSANLAMILDDNGAPQTGRSVVVNTRVGAKLRSNTQLTKANEAGTIMTLRQGELLELHNMSYKQTGQLGSLTHTAGTGASATTNTDGYAVGATTINLASAGTGTIVAGDLIKFATDDNWYSVVTGDTDVSNGGAIVIAAPGLMKAIPASATAITVAGAGNGAYYQSVAFTQDALVLAARAPAIPQEGDLALDRFLITDPRSGMVYEISIYPGYRKIRAEVACAWGWKAVKPAHMALLIG